MSAPLLVVEASEQAFRRAVAEVEAGGRRVLAGWRGGPGSVCSGVVADPGTAAEAVLAALGGAGVVVHAIAPREVVDRLVDDLRRLGAVEHRTSDAPAGPALTREEQELLELLAGGATLGAAAARLHLSRRTADRRLAAARRKLGASSTATAIVAYTRRAS